MGGTASWCTPPHSSPDPVPTLALTGTQTRFSQEPADQTVVAGQRAVLPCVLLNYSGIVQWTKDGLALGMGQGLKGEWGCAGSPAPRRPHHGLPPPPTKRTGLSILSFPPRSVSGLWPPLSHFRVSRSVSLSRALSLLLSKLHSSAFPPGLQTVSQRANGKPKESRETKRPLHRTALGRRTPLEEPQAAGPSRRGWEAPEPPARAEGGHSSFYVPQVSPACLALLQPLSRPLPRQCLFCGHKFIFISA